ncbi:hypothetical protein [Polyangium spumosum]|uniref:Uncharacterized protein n=1 Tax=Polyangium spumosum TaxID=889282 RepID=A0A6N7PXQ5_9BACT|nr:hypothetical protein [Polyangium spumosum]MRG95656.1 hypothetical protein [Polyangium spumosum]
MAERALVGNAAAFVLVVVALAELVIDAAPVAVAIAAAVEVTGEIAEARKRARWENECDARRTACLGSPLQSEWGDHWKSKRCNMCHNACRARKKWPDEIEIDKGVFVSRKYWPN